MREQIRAAPVTRQRSVRISEADRARRLMKRPKVLAGVGVGLAGLIVGLLLALTTASSPPPAFAATVNADRTVTITLREITAAGRLNARLAALGTRIRVVRVVRGCVAPVHTVSNGHVVPGPARTLEASPEDGAVVSMTIEVSTIRGRTFVVALTKNGLAGIDTVVVGPAPRCVGYASARSSTPLLPAGH
jgi:hypothetical protein